MASSARSLSAKPLPPDQKTGCGKMAVGNFEDLDIARRDVQKQTRALQTRGLPG
jgi:hypothetical protein